MYIEPSSTLVINKKKGILPAKGIICAHPQRANRIAYEFFDTCEVHTDYRGYQVYTGEYKGQKLFVANTGIGAPAAAFLIEELVTFGAKRILRLGSNDSSFNEFKLKAVKETTLPLGLCFDYQANFRSIGISAQLTNLIEKLANETHLPIELTFNRHIDGYYPINFSEVHEHNYGSQDMESGALYLVSRLRQIEYLSLLISYPKHETAGEYCDQGKTKLFEDRCIEFALRMLFIG